MALNIHRRLRLFLAGVLALLAAVCTSAAGSKNVVILHSFGREVAPFSAVADGFRSELLKTLGAEVSLYEVPLGLAMTQDPEVDDHVVEFLGRRFREKTLDLVVPIGAPAVQFMARYQKRLFSEIPIIYTGVDPRMLRPEIRQPQSTVVSHGLNLPGLVEDILRIQPGTTNIVVIFGSSPLERFWKGECFREFQPFTQRVGFTWLNHGNFDQILKVSSALPPHSAILFGLYISDELGIPYDGDLALKRLHAVANAPLYGYFECAFGKGIVGGMLYRDAEVGRQAAKVAIRVLRGERVENIPPMVLESRPPVYDARELRRWGIQEKDLPADRLVQFVETSFWAQYRWWICSVLVVLFVQSLLIIGLLISRDARRKSERNLRNTEEALRLSAARLVSAVDIAKLGFYEINAAFQVTFLDDRVRVLLGIPPGEESRMREIWLARIQPEDLSHVLEVSREISESRVPHATLEYRYLLPSGELRWLHHVLSVMKQSADGRGCCVMGVVQDITVRKQMEAASEQLREEIAHLTRVTTMGELTAALAHELNQPITAILNNAHAARRLIASGTADLQEIRDILVDIIADDQRAGEVVRRVRALIKKGRPHLQPLDMNKIILEVIRLVHTDALIKGVSIRTELEPALPLIRSDRVQLQQVLLNLIINAFDAMKNGGGERVVTVRTQHLPDDGVVVRVQDSGPGIPPDKLELIFNPFFSSKPGGMGMGLAISRTLITALGGRIWAESNVNGGGRLQFNLPLDGEPKS